MFLSKDDLKLAYGVDLTIASAYVNREVPTNNLYWKDRHIYIPSAPGYYFMPIYADLLFRCGADRDELLEGPYIPTCERILHSAARLENGMVEWSGHAVEVQQCIDGQPSRLPLYNELLAYLHQQKPMRLQGSRLGTAFPSLNRADSFLMAMATINSANFDEGRAIEGWYALMTYFLILDDLADIKDDLKTGEENALVEAGMDERGIAVIMEMIASGIRSLNSINPVMANRMDHKKSLIDLPALYKSIRQS